MSQLEATDSEARVEWLAHRERIVLSDADFERVQKLLENPPGPTLALKAAVARRNNRKNDVPGAR
ncbi:type II toxin -antitoxin system TacA 1-like antitoxin [Archangium lansingense]|uniref:DUF1778 domain-containing protein n=1 Tax=Archangium lansingense TaxID=2995310 RepID=A0ABT4AM79_9BACT|nr:DUF1778 domain-containing protein [Archangium lansinium]MCY1082803.1 DUF1778 domain-containing protein [Archangium lansinium]